jgi:hypothetical protein
MTLSRLKNKMILRHGVGNPNLDTAEKMFRGKKCFVCSTVVADEETLEDHFATHHSHCGVSDEARQALARAEKKFALEKETEEETLISDSAEKFVRDGFFASKYSSKEAKQPFFKCLICNRRFLTSAEAMARHVKEHEMGIPMVVYKDKSHGSLRPACHEINQKNGRWISHVNARVCDVDFPPGYKMTPLSISCPRCETRTWPWTDFGASGGSKEKWTDMRRGQILSKVKDHVLSHFEAEKLNAVKKNPQIAPPSAPSKEKVGKAKTKAKKKAAPKSSNNSSSTSKDAQ